MKKTYSTKDLAEAAAILTIGGDLEKIERTGDICWFLFKDYQKCRDWSELYFYGDLIVNAREFDQSLKRLKQMIFNKF